MPESPPLPMPEASDACAVAPVGVAAEAARPPAGAAGWLDFFAVDFVAWPLFDFDLAALSFFVDFFFDAPAPPEWGAAPAGGAPPEGAGLGEGAGGGEGGAPPPAPGEGRPVPPDEGSPRETPPPSGRGARAARAARRGSTGGTSATLVPRSTSDGRPRQRLAVRRHQCLARDPHRRLIARLGVAIVAVAGAARGEVVEPAVTAGARRRGIGSGGHQPLDGPGRGLRVRRAAAGQRPASVAVLVVVEVVDTAA